MQNLPSQIYSFDCFTLDLTRGCLLRDGQEVKLRPKSFEALKFLVENRGRLIGKEELILRLWPDSFVTDGSLTQCLRDVRLALGDDEQRYVKTVPRRGYIFATERAEQAAIEVTSGEIKTEPISHDASVSIWRRMMPAGKAATIFLSLAVSIAALAYFLIQEGSYQATTEPMVKSLAVLPFKPLKPAGRDEELGFGIADTLITRLGGSGQFIVRPVTAVRRYATIEQDALTAGREQRVDAVLEGSIQREGQKVRVTARLLRITEGQSLWGGEFEIEATELFAAQDEVSRKIIDSLSFKLTGDRRTFPVKRDTESATANQLYHEGRFFWNKRTEEGYYKAIDRFTQAIDDDPQYAPAYAGLADTWHLLGDYSLLAPRETFPKATAAALNAILLDDSLAEAHTALAYAKFLYDWDWERAESEFKRAIALNPSYTTARQWHAEYLSAMGRSTESQAEIKRALALDPTSLILNAEQGWVSYIAGDYDRAIERCRKTIDMDANFYPAHFWLGQACEMKGLYREAIAAYEKAAPLSGGSPEVLASLGHAYAASGERSKAEKKLGELKSLATRRYVSPYFLALIFEALGERPRALSELQKACADRSRSVPFLKVDPMYERLRGDSGFTALLRGAGLTQ
jgi:DNA-binding winged helix-turn-helix (wHTH) protein/TolB-like protein